MAETISELRTRHRKLRATLESSCVQANSIALQQQLESLAEYNDATHIASYIAIRGEIDTAPLMENGVANGKQFYLPVLDGERMRFAAWSPGQKLVKKGFGLLEPESAELRAPEDLDLVLSPLVVFDAHCNRIGQGGGFYDRTFAHRMHKSPPPVLLGVAHESQKEAALHPQSWDVTLDMVATDVSVYRKANV